MKNKKTVTGFLILFAFSAFLIAILAIVPRVKAPKPLTVYDVHRENPRIVKEDNTIVYADYVRIRNNTDSPYDLTGHFLSDSRKNLRKLPLDGVVINAHDSVMIRLDPSWNFALQRNGNESIYLSNNGNVLFEYNSKMKPSDPILSADSGFYDADFDLRMSTQPEYTIHYTVNGDEPGEDSPVYTDPVHIYDKSAEPNSVVNVPNTIINYLDDEVDGIPVEQPNEQPVDKAFIIRAVAMDEDGNKSDIVTREYFFCGDKYSNIISVVADSSDLFGPCGILSVGWAYDEWYLNGQDGEEPEVNYTQKGRDWEVPADMDYFLNDTKVLSQKCGLKLQGRTTRYRRIKNFQLRARKRYSESDVFEYDIFDEEPFRSDGIILDDNFKESVFLDLVRDESIVKQRTTGRTAMFLNGEFWNYVYIRQRLDEKYFEDNYGIEPENLIILAETFPETDYTNEQEYNEIREKFFDIYRFIEDNDLSIPKNYETLQTKMDIDTFIDYLAINTWIGNSDWAETQNDMYWSVKEPQDTIYSDGRFRWILHDGDEIFNEGVEIFSDRFASDCALYNSLMTNDEFRKSFAARLKELGSTSFSKNNVEKHLHSGKWDEDGLDDIEQFLLNRDETIDGVIDKIIAN